VRPLVETKVRDVVEEYDFDALASAIARREDPNEIAAHDSTFQLLASTRDVSHFATRARSRRRHLRGRDDADFGVETMSVEEHERREAALERETEDGDERPDLEDLLVVTRAAYR
jgi:predicted nucleic acid-binding protein